MNKSFCKIWSFEIYKHLKKDNCINILVCPEEIDEMKRFCFMANINFFIKEPAYGYTKVIKASPNTRKKLDLLMKHLKTIDCTYHLGCPDYHDNLKEFRSLLNEKN